MDKKILMDKMIDYRETLNYITMIFFPSKTETEFNLIYSDCAPQKKKNKQKKSNIKPLLCVHGFPTLL